MTREERSEYLHAASFSMFGIGGPKAQAQRNLTCWIESTAAHTHGNGVLQWRDGTDRKWSLIPKKQDARITRSSDSPDDPGDLM